jgi:hypothetical protein
VHDSGHFGDLEARIPNRRRESLRTERHADVIRDDADAAQHSEQRPIP